MRKIFSSFLIITTIFISLVIAQESDSIITSKSLSQIKFRSVGPAFMSGRIADIALHPKNNSIWYVAVGSGGVWKTNNNGTTWKSIFDNQGSYSIGCITIDPNNHNIIWVGTGENVGGRHVGYGDGIYKSEDGGQTWENMGLKNSEHISKIIVNPVNSNIVYAAVQGPLWKKGGERGFYKSTDFGNTWKKTLGNDEWVGVTDIVNDPRDPNLIYAATWQRHRNVALYIGGGPGSGIYRSVNGGESWEQLKKGIPNTNLGKIGLAISPQNPDVIYAAIELDRRTGGVFRSDNRGASWKKMSETVSGATGPHYYQELYASPHVFDKLYLVDVRMQISEDGGKTFRRMKEKYKHSDNHSVTFRYDDPNYLLVGTDGGIYETFDNTETWKFVNNLPVTQFYKVAVDDKEPFYNIYGGTQDNSTQGGPSRTDNVHGIRNSDWFLTLGGDGHQPATEPGNPNIIYSESQQGYLNRIDMKTGEVVSIQPQPYEGEEYERFNWDSPILVSPHSPTRLYFASQRLWKSENRGDSWVTISGDLTKNQNRMKLPIMGKTWSWDSPWDIYAMSDYNSITSISESKIKEGLIYIGTDDGIIQVTENGGKNWRKIDVSNLPDVPETAFVNDIKADLHDVNTVYVVLDNHKYGDLNPYLLKSKDKGKTWKSIKSNLPERSLLWRIAQDHVKPELLFLGTEFGVYFSLNGGEEWIQLKGGMPTISFRDLAIQKRENDLVCASFGRGFYVFDDYSFLRNIDLKELKNSEAVLYTGREALLYVPRAGHGFSEKGSQGSSYFTAKNPPFGAVFTYHLKEKYKTLKDKRKAEEKKKIKNNVKIEFADWEIIEAERREEIPKIWLVIEDSKGNVIRKLKVENKKGFHRINWDLCHSGLKVINEDKKLPEKDREGFLVFPGKYFATLSKEINGKNEVLSGPIPFKVKKLYNGFLEPVNKNLTENFLTKLGKMQKEVNAVSISLNKLRKKIDALKLAAQNTSVINNEVITEIYNVRMELFELDEELNGSRSKKEIGQKSNPTIISRLTNAGRSIRNNTYGPTQTQINGLDIVSKQFNLFYQKFLVIQNSKIPNIENRLLEAGAPIIK